MRVAIIAFIVLAGSVGAGTAGAAQLGIYAGISYSMVDKDSNRSDYANEALAIYNGFGFTPQTTTASFDAKDSSYGFVVGWRLSEHIALEGGYMDLGDVSYRDRSTGLFNNTPPAENWAQNVETSTSGIMFSALGILPLSYRWEVFLRGGVMISNSEESVFITDGIGSEKLRATQSGFDLFAGAGVSFSIAEIYNVRLEYGRVFDAGDDSTLDEADVDMATLNVTVSF
ncbi:MAG: outer membrane beta-barrel protein [Steroidobacteraceae bacterium]